MYFTHAYSPSEKGSIERANRNIRQFFPKKQSLYAITPAHVKEVQEIINHYPRKVLGWESAIYRYKQWQNAQMYRQKKQVHKGV